MKKLNLPFQSLLVLIFFLLSFTTRAQDLPGKRDSLYSDILKENRIVQVVLPENYKPGSPEKYDVLYLLDGESNLKSISAIQQFTQNESYMPPLIIVAVFNTDRNRDFLPTHVEGNATSGGADKFLAFFKNELIPYINKSYPTNGENTLYGHSFGGVFAMYALLSEPQLFTSYLSVDPSFWWDNGYMNKLAADKLSASQSNKSIFITGREGDGLKQMGIPGMDSVLKSKAPKELNWKIAAYPNESHGSVRLKSVYDGLKFFYDGYSNGNIDFHPMNGIVLKDKPYTIYYFGSSQSVYYTTNGSDPTSSSLKMGPENKLNNAATISAKSIGRNDRYNKITTGEFRVGKTLAPVTKPGNVKSGGLRYSYYEGEWDMLPDFTKLKPVQSGILNKDFNYSKLPRQTNFGCVVEGYIEILFEGYYIFVLDSDDGSKLFLGNNLLISHDGLHGGGNPKTFLIPLTKGFYPIRMELFQKAGGVFLDLTYVLPGDSNPQPIHIPFEFQYSKP